VLRKWIFSLPCIATQQSGWHLLYTLAKKSTFKSFHFLPDIMMFLCSFNFPYELSYILDHYLFPLAQYSRQRRRKCSRIPLLGLYLG
jgi:hypothetical protein